MTDQYQFHRFRFLRMYLEVPTLLILLVGLAGIPTLGWAQPTQTELQKLVADDAARGDAFGFSVSVSQGVALIGAFLDDDGGTDSGAAYIFQRGGDGTWIQQAKLVAADAAEGDEFGHSVSISNGVALIGARFDDDGGDDSGSAYVFRAQNEGAWTQEAKLTAADAAEGDVFGYSVSVSDDVALIGAPVDADGGTDSGSAYVFRDQGDGTWAQEMKLTAADAAEGDAFGHSVSLSNDVALVGAPYHNDRGTDSGSAHVFRDQGDGTWAQEARMMAPDAAAFDQFGYAVAISEDTALIGARFADGVGLESGAAYVFRMQSRGRWALEVKLNATDAAEGDIFGHSVSISNDVALIGAHLDDDNGADSGSAYVFRHQEDGTWSQENKLTAAADASRDLLGRSVSISGDVALVGAHMNDDAATNSGAAYVFSVASSATSNDATLNLPTSLTFAGSYPNPFNPQTTISFVLAHASDVRVSVYDMLGRQVAVLLEAPRTPGQHEMTFHAAGLSSGVYLYRIQTPYAVKTGHMTLLK